MFRRRYGCAVPPGCTTAPSLARTGGLNKIIARISTESFAARKIVVLPRSSKTRMFAGRVCATRVRQLVKKRDDFQSRVGIRKSRKPSESRSNTDRFSRVNLDFAHSLSLFLSQERNDELIRVSPSSHVYSPVYLRGYVASRRRQQITF